MHESARTEGAERVSSGGFGLADRREKSPCGGRFARVLEGVYSFQRFEVSGTRERVAEPEEPHHHKVLGASVRSERSRSRQQGVAVRPGEDELDTGAEER